MSLICLSVHCYIMLERTHREGFFNERLECVCRPCAEKFGSLVLSCVASWNERNTQSGKEIPNWPEITAKLTNLTD